MFEPSWNLGGRRVLVTGAASGMGRAIAHELYPRGARLVLVDRDANGLHALEDALPGARVHALDLRDRAAVARLADAVEAEGPLDLLFNNAGIGVPTAFERTSEDDFERIMDVNFHALVRLTRAVLPLLRDAARERREARIVNTSSLFGLMAVPDNTAYCASKFAVAGFSQSLGLELEGSGVGVSTVHPGGVATAIASNPETLARIPEHERAGHLERSARLLAMPPERAARIIVRGVERRRTRILVGTDARLGDLLRRVLPVHYYAVARAFTPDLR